MKVVELLKIEANLLKVLQNSCAKMDDYKYVGLYEEYREKIAHGEKSAYICASLARRYGISERQVYYLVKRLSADCKIDAVETI